MESHDWKMIVKSWIFCRPLTICRADDIQCTAAWSHYTDTTTAPLLHWLPVRQRVNFKIAVVVLQCLTGHAPSYLADDCQLAADASARRLRSADMAKCVVRRTYNNFGDRCFAAAGPRLWNMLPLSLGLCDSLGQFKRSLKTFLFGLWDHCALWH